MHNTWCFRWAYNFNLPTPKNDAECGEEYFELEGSVVVELRLFLYLDHSVWKKSYFRRGDYWARLLALQVGA